MALYHSAKGSVNYTVVGSPTIVDGVASGFSGSNYLQSSSTFPASTATSLVFSTKFKATSLDSTNCIVSSTSSTIPFHLGLRTDGKIRFYPGRESTSKDTSFVFSINTEYWIRLLWDSSGWAFQYSTDGITYTTDFANYSPSDSSPKSNYVVIGRNFPSGGSEGFSGTIDLNKTYITVNEQPWFGVSHFEVKKHQLMGPNGYTVTGTPTITDGLVSGFSSSDYLRLNPIPNSNIEMVFNFKTSASTITTQQTLLYAQYNSNAETLGICITEAGNVTFVVGVYGDVTYTTALSADTEYWIKCVITGTTATASISTDGTYYTTFGTINNLAISDTQFSNVYVGSWSGIRPFEGSLNLNNTYIKVNGKLWFWQPQETKKIIVNGVTVWQSEEPEYVIENGRLVSANPNLYLESDGNAYIKVSYTPVQNDSISSAFMLKALSSRSQYLYCLKDGVGGSELKARVTTDDWAFYFDHFNNGWSVIYFQPIANEWHEYTIGANGIATLTPPGDSATSSYIGAVNTSDLFLFAYGSDYSTANYLNGAMKAFKITNNGTDKLNLVPVRQGLQIGNYTVPSNGMFDIVSQTFYGNLGSGSFTVGKDE